MSVREPVLTIAELETFLAEQFPERAGNFSIEEIASMRARLRMQVTPSDLRPGGTVSGPTMFAIADYAFYVVTLAMIGREPLTVTVNMSINFLRKPALTDLIAEARILKLGRTLSVGDVTVWSDGAPDPVAHASVTYSIPPKRPTS